MSLRLSGPAVLLMIRDGKANTLAKLAPLFGGMSIEFYLRSVLVDLRNAGLVECEAPENMSPLAKIRISPSWRNIQTALGFSLSTLARRTRDDITVRPLWGAPDEKFAARDVFVLMPFDERSRPVYDDHIVKVAQELGLSVARADDEFAAKPVMEQVWAGIYNARVVVADCTGRNPNVFYEIGIAHSIGKSVVLVTQSIEDIPFDIHHVRHIRYAFTPRGMIEFEKELARAIRASLGDVTDESPK